MPQENALLNAKPNHPAIHATLWIAVCVGVPGIPIIVGILAAVLQQVGISLTSLFDGIELCLVSVGMVATTFVDLSKSDIDWSSRQLIAFYIKAVLLGFGILSVIFLTLLYINYRVAPLNFNSDVTVLIAFGNLVIVASVSLTLQYYISYTHYKRRDERG